MFQKKCVLGSNTSSISITSLQAELKNLNVLSGFIFSNPAPLMPLVGGIPGLLTENNLAQEIVDFMKSWVNLLSLLKMFLVLLSTELQDLLW